MDTNASRELLPKRKFNDSNRGEGPTVCTCLPFDVYPWLVLFCLCWITFGSYWVFDTPGAIQTQITAWFGGTSVYSDSDNLTLYSVYSFPNMFLAFLGGVIIDRFLGVRMGTFLFCLLIFLGNVLFAIGMQFRLYWLCVVGRLVFGLGGESLTVGQNAYTTRWFDGKILALAFGIVLAFARIGSSINFAVTPLLASIGVPFSVWFGSCMCLLSLVACVYLSFMDWYGDARIRKKDGPMEVISFRHIKEFPIQAWIIFLVCVFFYVSVLTFYTVASDIMQHTGGKYAPDQATFYLFIPNLVAIPASPTFGFLIDKKGRSLVWLTIACIMQVIAHIIFWAMTNDMLNVSPAWVMVWIGIGYSMFAASIWPLLPFVIREPLIGTGYGMMTSIQNAGLALFPLAIGQIQEAPSIKETKWKYIIPIMIFIGCAAVAFVLTALLWIIDKRLTGGVLNANGDVKQKHKQQLNAQNGEIQ